MNVENERRLILHRSVSMDGFVNQSDGKIDWHAPRGEGTVDKGAQRHRINLELESQIDVIVMGSGAYTEMSQGWMGSDTPMAEFMNGVRKVVFTQSLQELEWNNATITRRPPEKEISRSSSAGKATTSSASAVAASPTA